MAKPPRPIVAADQAPRTPPASNESLAADRAAAQAPRTPPAPAPRTQPSSPADSDTSPWPLSPASDVSRPDARRVGSFVAHTAVDPYAGAGGEKVTRHGLVTEFLELEGDRPAVRVAWLVVSDPILVEDLDSEDD
ncbi:MAG: hypothetical protein ACR2MO_08570 [Acidimicrobiales bacterium]